jgi:hypothetical protein
MASPTPRCCREGIRKGLDIEGVEFGRTATAMEYYVRERWGADGVDGQEKGMGGRKTGAPVTICSIAAETGKSVRNRRRSAE